ncbi:MAG: bifunctional diaminohydroxyphosphoribosylaminopyrimidine deaminase/5-amino-6-(5-phosphoribosylamino)uracil reductase RibD, partial [Rubrivivax sp.]
SIALSDPNPRVGCVIVSAEGQVLGEGHTQQAGGPHAEVMALRDAEARGLSVVGATAHVTLEPCAHHGRTPPCADALVGAGLARVVVALVDPNPLVGGQGVARLRSAGVEVEVLPPTHPAAIAASELNIGFLSRMVRQRPWVRLKVAASLDGRTALPDGRSQWITGEAARADGHAWRARATAVLTGIGTVLDDNPRLDVRAVPVARQPWRVVLDSRWRTPPDAALLSAVPGDVLVYGTEGGGDQMAARRQALAHRGVQVVVMPHEPTAARRQTQTGGAASETVEPAKPGTIGGEPATTGLDLAAVLADLARRGVNELHVEAGARLNAALIEGGWVDELLVYLAPTLLGPGRPFADLGLLPGLAQAPRFEWRDVAQVGADLRLIARRPGADLF